MKWIMQDYYFLIQGKLGRWNNFWREANQPIIHKVWKIVATKLIVKFLDLEQTIKKIKKGTQ